MKMNKVDAEKYYSLSEIIENNFFSWISSVQTLSKWVENDKQNGDILKANIKGEDTGKRYYIKGENIIKFIAMFEDGSLHMDSRKEVIKMEDTQTEEEKVEEGNTAVNDAQAAENTGESTEDMGE